MKFQVGERIRHTIPMTRAFWYGEVVEDESPEGLVGVRLAGYSDSQISWVFSHNLERVLPND